MKDHRYVDELTLEELEEAVRIRRRAERLKRLPARPDASDPLRSEISASEGAVADRPGGAQLAALEGSRYSAVIETRARTERVHRPIKWRWVWDKALLLVEIVALGAFVFVVSQLLLTVRGINEESRQEMTLPTPTPTPMIRAALLPGAHTPPDADKRSEPGPIPVHLRDLVTAITPMPVPTAGPEHGRRILIPAINVDAPIVEGDDWEALKKGVGHTVWSANPGERGNCVLSAHNDIYGEIFRDLAELKVGDVVQVETLSRTYRYSVEQTRIIKPTEVEVMAQTSTPVLTLISCYPYGIDSHSIVVMATLLP